MSNSQEPDFSKHVAVSRPLMPKKHPITNDYTIYLKSSPSSPQGGDNRKIVECVNKKTGEKRILKVSDYLQCTCTLDLVC